MRESNKHPNYIVKYKPDLAKCKCGQETMFYAQGVFEVPYGFGGHEDGMFYVDKVQFRGWFADCPRGHITMAYQSKKLVSKQLKLKKGEKKWKK